jgi:uncharacterized membrane protein YphA (DoxX/SURF4 family)
MAFRVGLAAAWLWAGWTKVADPQAAVRAVQAYELLPQALVRPVAWGLPFVELALAVMLILGIGLRTAGVLSLVLLGLFTGAVASAWARGLTIACGCFGGGGVDTSVRWTTYALEIGRDLLFAAMAMWLVIRPASPFVIGRD